MSINDQKPFRAAFSVIQGGLAEPPLFAASPTAQSLSPAMARLQAEEERLRQALLRLKLPVVRVSVAEAIDEMGSLADAKQDASIGRRAQLDEQLRLLGITFQDAEKIRLLDRSYWAFGHPDRALRRHPELAPFYPEAHALMVVAWPDR